MQAGSYVFMDLAYRREGLDFEHALTVLATVVSANHAGFVTVDAGFKAFATDRLAAGARMLRDIWWTAWVTSAASGGSPR